MPDGPGFPRHPPSTYATKSGITRFFVALRKIEDALNPFRRQDDYLIPFQPVAVFDRAVQFRVQNKAEIAHAVDNFLPYIHLHFELCTGFRRTTAPKLCVDFFACSVSLACVDG